MDLISGIQFDSFAEFLDMGGYSFNVWAVYGLFVVFITVNLYVPVLRRKSLIRDLKRRQTLAEQAHGAEVNSAGRHKLEEAEGNS